MAVIFNVMERNIIILMHHARNIFGYYAQTTNFKITSKPE